MKNKKLLLSLLALTVLTSCGNTIGGLKKGDDILNGTIIDNNFEEVEEEVEVNTLVQSNLGEVSFKQEEILYHYSCGVVVTINEQGYVGFYSLLHQKQIIANQYEEKWVKYQVRSNNETGFFIIVQYEGIVTYYDSVGNVIYTGNEKNEVNYSTEFINETVYLTLEVVDEEGAETIYYKYLETGKLQKVENITDDVLANLPVVEETEFPFGSQYNEMYPLEEFGLKGYVSIADDLMIIYNENKEYIATVTVPSNAKNMGVITNKFYYQVINALPEDSKDYDFYYGEISYKGLSVKCSLDTYSINLETGKVKEEDVEFIIVESSPYKGETDGQNYSILTMQLINKDKTLGEVVSYLIDSKGVLHDRVDGIEIHDFVKVGSNYLNEDTGILYDSSLKEIAYIGSIYPEYDEKSGYIEGWLDDKYGILDTNGKVVLEFSADEKVSEIVDNKVITYRDGIYYRNDLLTGEEETLGVFFEKIGNGLFVVQEADAYKFHNAAGLLKSVKTENMSYFNYNFISTEINNAQYIILETEYTTTEEVFDEDLQDYVEKDIIEKVYTTLDINQLPSLTTIGADKITEIAYGEDEDNPLELKLGDNTLHAGYRLFGYYSFTPEVDGYYTFISDSEVRLDVTQKDLGYQTVTEEVDAENDLTYHTVLLYKDFEYIFAVSPYYWPQDVTLYDYSFELEQGDNSSYPLIYGTNNNEVIINEYGYAYIKFIPEYDGNYTVDVEDGYVMMNGYSYYDGDTVYLEKDVELDVEYYSSTDTSKVKKIDFIVDSSKQDVSMSLFTASELSTDSENMTTVNYTNEFGNYFKYTNTSTVDQFVTLAGTASAYHSTKYNVYDSELNEVDSGTNFAFYYSDTIEVIVKAGQTVYFELTSDTSATDYIYISTLDAQADLLLENTTYEITTPTLFKVEVNSPSKLAQFTYSSSSSVEVKLYDENGKVVDTFYSSTGETNEFLVDGTKTYYVYVEPSSTVEISFDLISSSTSNLYLYIEGLTLAENYLSTDDGKWYAYTNISTENQVVRFEVIATNSYSSRYVKVINTDGYFGSYSLYSSFYNAYYIKPGETVYIKVENSNSNYELYYTIKAKLQ